MAKQSIRHRHVLHRMTACHSRPIILETHRRPLRWFDHALRMPQDRIPKVAFRWTPTSRQKSGKSNNTWRRQRYPTGWGRDRHEVGSNVSQDRVKWREVVAVLLCWFVYIKCVSTRVSGRVLYHIAFWDCLAEDEGRFGYVLGDGFRIACIRRWHWTYFSYQNIFWQFAYKSIPAGRNKRNK